MRTMRWLVFSLIAVAGVFGLTTVAQQQQPAQPVTEIKIVPENPTVNSEIKVELSGTFPNACAPTADEVAPARRLSFLLALRSRIPIS